MTVNLTPGQFVNNKLTVNYGIRKRAIFTIINENFPGLNRLGTINLVTVLIQTFNTDGTIATQNVYTPIISVGNPDVQIVPSTDSTLQGQRLSQDNMQGVLVTLVE
jgi:hypothetical protein